MGWRITREATYGLLGFVAGATCMLLKPANNAVYNLLTREQQRLIGELAGYNQMFRDMKPTTSCGAGGAGPLIGGLFVEPSSRDLRFLLRYYQEGENLQLQDKDEKKHLELLLKNINETSQ